jgi:hypothetical protein
MPNIIDNNVDAFGLKGGRVLSGSVTVAVDAYVYYPLQTSVANIVISNLISGSFLTSSWSAGIPIYGNITSITQSSGLSIVYSGSSLPAGWV